MSNALKMQNNVTTHRTCKIMSCLLREIESHEVICQVEEMAAELAEAASSAQEFGGGYWKGKKRNT